MLSPDCEIPSGERVTLLDFGIAKLTGAATALTAGVMGTPDYLAPEQWQDPRAVDGRADAYSLGCVAFEMVSGHVPFPATSVAASCKNHLATPAPSLRKRVPYVPRDLASIVGNLLRKDPDERPAMREVEHAFAHIVSARVSRRRARPRRPSIRRATVLTETAVPIDSHDACETGAVRSRWPVAAGVCAGVALFVAALCIRFGVANAGSVASAAMGREKFPAEVGIVPCRMSTCEAPIERR